MKTLTAPGFGTPPVTTAAAAAIGIIIGAAGAAALFGHSMQSATQAAETQETHLRDTGDDAVALLRTNHWRASPEARLDAVEHRLEGLDALRREQRHLAARVGRILADIETLRAAQDAAGLGLDDGYLYPGDDIQASDFGSARR
ncbi:MAG: hypothetical protein K9M02_09050 [Thiohalocapsa sp.]|jgi:hypothetical protein|nr:hypothetical protein [Thiohalocapsa sp.]